MPIHRATVSPWDNDEILRAELFSSERLEQHAASLAAAQGVTRRRSARRSLDVRLKDNESVLLAAYRAIGAAVGEGRPITPAAEWLLDNYHLVEEQIREIREDLPPGFYRQLPKLADGPFAGYPRVFGLAWAFIAHSDSRFDPDSLRLFVRAYQRIQPLTIGELWAVAITLRIVLVENLRRAVGSERICGGAGRVGLPRCDRRLFAPSLCRPVGAAAARSRSHGNAGTAVVGRAPDLAGNYS
jgi:cyclic beta-1,2-glucan synthetase